MLNPHGNGLAIPIEVEEKVFVSTISAPTSKYLRCTALITSRVSNPVRYPRFRPLR